MQTSVILKGSA